MFTLNMDLPKNTYINYSSNDFNWKFRCAQFIALSSFWIELDRVGPSDKRPSADKLHHFVQKK